MARYAGPIEGLIRQLVKLPGIGEKTAARLALHILRSSTEDVKALAESLVTVKESIRLCSVCYNLTEMDPCSICKDLGRRADVICVVEGPGDLIAIEMAGIYDGKYHVLHGVLSPLDGVGPEDIKIKEFLARIEKGGVKEVIIATNPSVEGEATSLYLNQKVRSYPVKVTRIAYGIPAGGDLEYTDKLTLGKALENRREM
jgi:recombination protein RecR